MNILDLLKDQVTGSLAKQAAGFLGESEEAVTSGLGSAFPAILGSMIDKGTSDEGASGIMGMIKGLDMNMLGDIGSLFGGGASSVNGLLNSGGGILDMLLGDKLGGVADLIGKVSGLKSGSSSSLLKMAAPFLMSMIGKKIMGKGPGALIDLLMGQKDHVAKAMPSGMGSLLGLANLGGLGDGLKNVADAASGMASGAGNMASGAVKGAGNLAGGAVKGVGNVASGAAGAATGAAKSGLGWLKGAIPLLLIGAAAWYFLMGPGASKVADAANAAVETTKNAAGSVADGAANAAGAVADGAGAVVDAAGSAFSKVNDAAKSALDKITFTTGSAGSQMMDYINGGFKGDGVFKFNNVNFATGSAQLTKESAAEIDNLAAIMKAYEGVKVEIQGHTDNTGNAAKNKTLSQARAASVVGRLMGQGVDASRMAAVGYGAEQPTADNGTAEGRAANRRIEAKLVK